MKHPFPMVAVALFAAWTVCTATPAAVPRMIQYQGHLTDADGAPLDTAINMTFTIYDDSTEGTVWWTETQTGVIVNNGLFNVLLGSVNAIVDTVFSGNFRWLGIQIASDPEIVPRTRLVTVPWAYRVSTLDGATGGHVFGSIQLHSDLVIGELIQGEPGGLYVTNGDEPFLQVDGSTEQVGIGMIDPNAQFHVETTDFPYSASFTSFLADPSANVVHAEYLGTDPHDVYAIYGQSAPVDYYGYGGYFQGGYMGVHGEVYPTGDQHYAGVRGYVQGGSGTNYGIFGDAGGSGENYGVVGFAGNVAASVNYGVYGQAIGSEERYAIYGDADSAMRDFAGYFHGNVNVTGTLGKGGGGFKIDHPLDPAGKYLYHSFVESPDMKNVYDGVVTLDVKGEATVELPVYFDAVNRDFRYQLTAIGAPGPNLYIAEKIADNRFTIAGGEPGMEVCWQVTGIRKDGFAEAYRIQVEVDKPVKEQGRYLHPEVYGLGQEYGIHYEEHKRMKELQEKSAQKMEQR